MVDLIGLVRPTLFLRHVLKPKSRQHQPDHIWTFCIPKMQQKQGHVISPEMDAPADRKYHEVIRF